MNRDFDSIFSRPPAFVTQPFDESAINSALAFRDCNCMTCSRVSGELLTAGMIERTMQKINAQLPPPSEQAASIECSGDLYEALCKRAAEQIIRDDGMIFHWLTAFAGLPMIFDPTLKPGTFIAHMLDDSSVMHYANGRKVRCLNCDEDLTINGDPSAKPPEGVIQASKCIST